MPNKRDPNKVSVSDYWPKEFHAAFKAICQAKGITVADGLKEACAEWLEKQICKPLPTPPPDIS